MIEGVVAVMVVAHVIVAHVILVIHCGVFEDQHVVWRRIVVNRLSRPRRSTGRSTGCSTTMGIFIVAVLFLVAEMFYEKVKKYKARQGEAMRSHNFLSLILHYRENRSLIITLPAY